MCADAENKHMAARCQTLTKMAWSAIGGQPGDTDSVVFEDSGGPPSVFAVTDIAAATIATAGLSIAEFVHAAHGVRHTVTVDRRLSCPAGMSGRAPMSRSPPRGSRREGVDCRKGLGLPATEDLTKAVAADELARMQRPLHCLTAELRISYDCPRPRSY